MQEQVHLPVIMAAAVAAVVVPEAHPATVVMAHKARLSLPIRLKRQVLATF
jgi:hypothetical protein